MGQSKRKVVPVASRHLVCLNCRSWVDFKTSGCGKTWAETRGESFAFTCKAVFCPGFQKGRVPSQKGKFCAVNRLSKGHFSAVNGLKRAL